MLTLSYLVDGGPPGLDLQPRIGAPAGWQVLSGSGGFRLGERGAEVQLLVLAVPATAAAGDYDIVYGTAAESERGREPTTRRVRVAAIDRLQFDVVEQPRRVLAGESYEAVLRLSNQSNREHQVELRWSQSRMLPTVVSPTSVRLAAGENSVVRVEVAVPAEIHRELRHTTSLTARFADAPSVVGTASLAVTVFPTRTTDTSRWHRLQGDVTLRGLSASGQPLQPGGTLLLSGALDNGDRRHLTLFAQAPEISSRGSVVSTLREEIYLDFAAPGTHLLVGDFDPPPSRLLSRFRGRGGRVSVGQGAWRIGASAVRTARRGGLDADEGGLFVELDGNERAAARLDYVQRRLPKTGADGRFLDLNALLRPRGDLALRLSLAWGDLRQGGAARSAGLAAQMELLGQRQSWSYQLVYLQADAGFPGQHSGQRSLFGGVNARLGSRLSLQSSLRNSRAPEEPDLVYAVPPTEQELTNGLYLRLSEGSTLSLERRERSREERNEITAVRLQERTLRLSLRQRLGPADLTLRVESGDGEDEVARQSFALDRYTLEGAVRLGDTLDLSANLEHTREDPLAGDRDGYLSALVRGRWQVDPKVALEMSFYHRERRFRIASDLSYGRLRLSRRLPHEHELSLELARSIQEGPTFDRTDNSVMLSYSLPLSVPVARRHEVGSVTGWVHDAASGLPLAGVMVRVGQAAARTDRNGSFTIAAIDSGWYPIVVDAAAVDYRLLSSPANPETIVVGDDEAAVVDLTLLAAAALAGWVRREPSQEIPWTKGDKTAAAEAPVADLVLEASNGRQTLRRITEVDGHFSFAPLLPGTWSLRIVGLLPAGYVASLPSPIALAQGERRELEILLKRQPHRMRSLPVDPGSGIQVLGSLGSPGNR